MMRGWRVAFGVLLLAERVWKHWMVVRFFRRAPPEPPEPRRAIALVSILQPILSGDPTLMGCLERNLRMRTAYPLEYLWLVDSDDPEARRICQDLIARYPERSVRLIVAPPPAGSENPKTVKLVRGAAAAHGEVICVLDDDTVLPDNGLEQCLPYLDQPGVGLAFGWPYYESFMNLWSRLVAYFVNSNSLLTYIPYAMLTEPFTINGMFYAARREVLLAVGGFAGLEGMLADDFAVAQRFRGAGYRLAQTLLGHGISTFVRGPRHYFSLMRRWFIFPRESILRYLGPREQGVVYGLGLLPALVPPLLVASLVWRPSRGRLAYAALYLGYSFAIFVHLNQVYLRRASPWRHAWLVPLIELLFPIQLIAALLSPRRITWRGHQMRVARGGSFRMVRRLTRSRHEGGHAS